jgi:hypothetical protein
MQPRSLNIDDTNTAWLGKVARRTGRSQSAIVRLALWRLRRTATNQRMGWLRKKLEEAEQNSERSADSAPSYGDATAPNPPEVIGNKWA